MSRTTSITRQRVLGVAILLLATAVAPFSSPAFGQGRLLSRRIPAAIVSRLCGYRSARTLDARQSDVPAPHTQDLFTPEATPLNPVGTGCAINIYGEGETAGFADYATEAVHAHGRPLTSTLPARVASDISMRDAPLSSTTLAEMQRLARPGARITYANADVFGFAKYVDQLRQAFPIAKILRQEAITGANGYDRGIVVLELPK